VKCHVKKQYVSHWAVDGLPQEFVVENKNTWDPHPVNITNVELVSRNYDTIAESERGPQIVEHLNSLCVQFHVDPKYKESVKVLSNFIRRKMFQL